VARLASTMPLLLVAWNLCSTLSSWWRVRFCSDHLLAFCVGPNGLDGLQQMVIVGASPLVAGLAWVSALS